MLGVIHASFRSSANDIVIRLLSPLANEYVMSKKRDYVIVCVSITSTLRFYLGTGDSAWWFRGCFFNSFVSMTEDIIQNKNKKSISSQHSMYSTPQSLTFHMELRSRTRETGGRVC